MNKPFDICIENPNARSKTSRYLRCVALPGRQPGQRLDSHGRDATSLEFFLPDAQSVLRKVTRPVEE